MTAYADSSIIAALYVQQAKSAEAVNLVQRHLPLPFTPWHRLEVRNAIRRASTPDKTIAAITSLEQDLSAETVVCHQPIDWIDCLRHAEELSKSHNPGIGASSPDLFHVACALEFECKEFLTFEIRQFELAKAVGLKVKGL